MIFKTTRFTYWAFGLLLMLGMLGLLSAHVLPTSSSVAQAAPLLGGGVSIDSVDPDSGFNDQDTLIYINGSGFSSPAIVTLGTQPLEVQDVSYNLVIAKVPEGLTPGFYDLTVQCDDEEDTAENAFEVKGPPVVRDLKSQEGWLWTEPFPMRVGYSNSGVGLNVQHLGSRYTLQPVTVEFRLDSASGTVLGRTQTSQLGPNAMEATSKVIWEPTAPGMYTICAIIDPDNEVAETDESDNVICRTLAAIEYGGERIPPIIDSFDIQDGAYSTEGRDVTLDATATDYPIPGASGMRAIKFIEFEYNHGARHWQWVAQSEWLDYDSPLVNHPWQLLPTYGTRYIQAWAVDHDDNFSSAPNTDVINLLPSVQEDSVARNDVVIYRIRLEEGESFQATLTSVSGDADLYIWGPNSVRWESFNYSSENTVDAKTFIAPNTGTYQIEVYGFTAAQYRLNFGTVASASRLPFQNQSIGPKAPRTEPAIALDVEPFYRDFGPPLPDDETTYQLYLPMAMH